MTQMINLILQKSMQKQLMEYFFIKVLLYIKMVTNYYQKNKEKLQKEARETYQNLSEEEK